MHIPAGALVTEEDLGLALILEGHPVELKLVAANLLDSLGALVVKLERHPWWIHRARVRRTAGNLGGWELGECAAPRG